VLEKLFTTATGQETLKNKAREVIGAHSQSYWLGGFKSQQAVRKSQYKIEENLLKWGGDPKGV